MGDAGISPTANGNQDDLSNGISLPEPIAVVGMGMRLPGGIHTAEDFWNLLVEKRSTRCRVPSDRFDIDAFHDPSGKAGSIAFEYGHFLAESDNLEQLDTSFFSMSRKEVHKLDPQQRMMLEVVHECMENAGQTNWRGKDIGVYVGVWGEDWMDIHAKDPQDFGMYRIAGSHDFAISNRVSYEYDLRGPSLTIKTACSSSLTGVHEAVMSLRSGGCSGAIVAGTNLIFSPTMSIAMTEQGVMSPEGRCKTFDASANGYARGEAINAIYLKKLSDALRDSDPIRAIIRHSGLNCDGKTPGISMPSSEAHEALMRSTYKEAHLNPHDTPFVELHGTGTPIGDPLEASAVSRCFGSDRSLYIGSLKPNMGHSEGASGVSSVIKSIMALEHKTIPPNINFKTPNPKIPFEKANMKVPLEPIPWPECQAERISVNSFGIGGANAHVILESSTSYQGDTNARSNSTSIYRINSSSTNSSYVSGTHRSKPSLLVASAENQQSLGANIVEITNYSQKHANRLGDISYTLCNRRQHFSNRSYCVTTGTESLTFSPPSKLKRCPSIVFVFTGQGAQWGGMAKELMEDYPSFDRDISVLNGVLQNLSDPPSWDIKPELIKIGPMSFLRKAVYAQPLVTAVQIALVNLFRSWGISPSAVIGHSSGEMAAAYAAGAITAEEAIIIAYYRGKITKSVTTQGGMVAVGLGREDVTPFLVKGAIIACENSGSSVTLSGDEEALSSVCAAIKGANPDTFVRKLQVEMAYHSHHMREVGDLYENLLTPHVKSKAPTIPFFSSVKGKVLTHAGDFDAQYWRSNLENPVLFYSAVRLLINSRPGDQLFLEIGPHSALAGPIRQILKSNSRKNDTYSTALNRGLDCTASALKMAGELHVQGIPLNFSEIAPGKKVLTDLPLYQWKHDEVYWSESRISRDWRFRKFPHHELLGGRTLESTALEPEWRVVLRLEEVPWLRDHKIIDDVVFPCAGYLCMAVEAVRQIATADDFALRNIVVQTALILTDTNATEMVTSLRPVKLTNTLDSVWWDFSISSYNGNSWMKHCSGQIRSGQETSSISRTIETHPRPVGSPYTIMKKIGLNYGPAFQGLQDCSALPAGKTASATLKIAVKPASHYVMHPTTIDHCLQIMILATSAGLARYLDKLCVPTGIDYLYIGPYSGDDCMRAEATSTVLSTGIIHGNVIGVSGDRVNFSLIGGQFSPIESDSSTEDADRIAGSRLVWMPHLDFMDLGDLVRPNRQSRSIQEDTEKLTLLSIAEIQREIVHSTPEKEFLQKFKTWIDDQIGNAQQGQYALVPNSDKLLEMKPADQLVEIKQLEASLRGTECGPAAELLSRIRTKSSDIINEAVEGIELLLPDDGLTHFYNALEARTDCKNFFAAAGHLKPTLRVLEVGAGTGGTTAVVLKSLTSGSSRIYSKYTYTDVSSGFFATAQERFKSFDGIEYNVLDISKDPLSQGFEEGSYDLIVAANVLHATPSLHKTLSNVRKLLAQNGRVFLQELSPEVRSINLIMGILPGWWLGEADGRSQQPYISPERWDVELKKAGFAGVESAIYDEETPYHQNANIISRPSKVVSRAPKLTFLVPQTELVPEVKLLESKFKNHGYDVDYRTLHDSLPFEQPIISLLELSQPFFEQISEANFISFQKFVENVSPAGLLWITRTVQRDVADPRFGLSLGLARSLRNELSIPLATIELDTLNDYALATICTVFEQFQNRTETADVGSDYEFVLEKGVVKVGRFNAVSVLDELLVAPSDLDATRLEIGKFGLLQTLQWVRYSPEELSPDCVVIEPRCAGLNFKDVLVSMGIVDGSGLGLEGSGVITEVGADVKDHFKVGDRVLYLGQNCFSTRITIPAKRCAKIPSSMSWEDAATMPCVYATVIHSLIDIGRLRKGQSVLIHSACGGIGLSAIQICQKVIGAQIYCTAGNQEKVQYLMNSFGIPRERIFNSRDTSFLPAINAATRGRGVDLVLNSLSGELLHASWNCVAEYGKMVEIGKRDFIGKAKLNMDLFEFNRSFIGVDLARFDSEMIEPLLAHMVELATAEKIRPITPIKVFEGSKVEDAFRYMQKGAHIGKIVVTIPEDRATLPVALSTTPLSLSADASYLIVGGLGGLGRSVSTWMVEHGARNLIYLSRSAGNSESDQAFFEELKSQGCTATAVAGSVSVQSDVHKCVELAPKPIKGVLQMSMVLRDGAFLSMSYSDWNEVLGPKVQGTWNLHHALPKDLDFFVATSSISGTFGNYGQANYAAANTFLDSFIQWRNSQGLAGSVLDVGVMADIGYVSQNAGIQDALRAAGTYALHEQEFLDAIQWAIMKSNPGTEKAILGNSQVAIGVRATKPLSEPSCRVNWKRDIRMSADHNERGSSSDSSDSRLDALKEFIGSLDRNPEALNTHQAIELITHEIGVKIYAFMMRPVEEIDTSLALSALGVDSLVTIEVRNWMKRSMGAELSTLEILSAGTIDALGAAVVKTLKVKSSKKGVEAKAGEAEEENFMAAIPLPLHHPMKA